MVVNTEARRVPRQSRGWRRVDALLDAAASEISAVGYQSATMSAIAARAGAPIGSLYQFYPSKLAIAQALRARYAEQFEQLWAPLVDEARHLTLEELANRLVDSTIFFIKSHPAFLALIDVSPSAEVSIAVREKFQQLVAGFLIAHKPRMSHTKALRLATVILHMVKSRNFLFRNLSPNESRPYIQEFKILLRCYLEARMHSDQRSGGCL